MAGRAETSAALGLGRCRATRGATKVTKKTPFPHGAEGLEAAPRGVPATRRGEPGPVPGQGWRAPLPAGSSHTGAGAAPGRAAGGAGGAINTYSLTPALISTGGPDNPTSCGTTFAFS